jgi:TolB-like protein
MRGDLTRSPAKAAETRAGDRGADFDDCLLSDELRDQLQRILNSPAFEASERRKRFLRYIMEETLAGRADRLKGYSIATAVFGRDDSFDPQTDPVVRLEARRLRRALEHYYLTAGRDDPIRIEIPKGRYAPICERQGDALPVPPAASSGALRPGDLQRLPPGHSPIRWRGARAAGMVIGLAVLLIVLTGWWLARAPSGDEAVDAAADRQLAGPGAVVLPFVNLTGIKADDAFADSLTEELISSLTRFEDLRVYAARRDGQGNQNPGALASRPDVRYLIRGSVHHAPGRVRVILHLIEADSGRYLWSETYERPLPDDNPIGLEREFAAEIAGRLAEPYGVVREVTAGLPKGERPEILRTYECVSQAYTFRRTFSPDVYKSARDCLETAVRRDPSRPDAWAMLAYAYLDEYRWYGFGPRYRQPEALDQALAAAQRARELDPDSVLGLTAYSAVQFIRGKIDEAEAAQRRAVELNPNNPEPLIQLGWRIAFARDWDRGMAMVREGIGRSRAADGWYYILLALDDYRRDDCPAALADAARAGAPFFFMTPALEAVCQAELGNPGAARKALEGAVAFDPWFAKDPAGAFRLHRTPESLIAKFMAGLRKAGLEGASREIPSAEDATAGAPEQWRQAM